MTTSPTLAIDDESAWEVWRAHWRLRGDTIYLNHGSFGPPPKAVQAKQRWWKDRLDEQPMDFFVRQYEPAWRASRDRLAGFVGASPQDLVFVENATAGMNVVADSFSLKPGDQVLLTDHEYGAVLRIWRRACLEAGADEPVIAPLPLPMESAEQIVDAIFARVTAGTRLIVVSHVTSATAVILPVEKICQRAKQFGIAVCIDGAHATVQVPLNIAALGCDFYTATCHKWLSAPFGSAFLYVSPQQQATIRAPNLSWGRLPPDEPQHWSDEFLWTGTRDPSSYFTIPTAIDFIEAVGVEDFRFRTHTLAQYARQSLSEITNVPSLFPDSAAWYGSMALVPLPPVDPRHVQTQLWQQFGIEVPAPLWNNRPLLRVSCHLYNRPREIETLATALRTILAR